MEKNVFYNKEKSIAELQISRSNHNTFNSVIKRIERLYVDKDIEKNDKLICEEILIKNTFVLQSHVIEEISKVEDSNLMRYLRYRYAYDVLTPKKVTTSYPPVVQIEPASICNYRCIFCYQTDENLTSKKNGHMGLMSMELFKKIIDQISGKVESVTLASRGEPTVNKNLSEMIRYLSGKFLSVKINTNAFLLNDEISHAILSSNVQTLVFSADAAEKETYKKIRINGDFDRVVRNIDRFNEIKSQFYPDSKIITRVSGVYYDKENQNIDEMQLFWGKMVDQVMFVNYLAWEDVYNLGKNDISEPCSDLWRRMFIWWDGKVAPCDVDYLTTLSNESIFEKSITDIWQGEMYTNLRKMHLNKERACLEPCSRCDSV
jgi:MoaA/NifB/PqqE/SkfB family radical SAM enzyme